MTDFRNPNRRTLLKGGAALLAAPAILPRSALGAEVLYVNTWGGGYTEVERKAFFEPFTKETGIEIRTVAPVSFSKLKAQVQSNNYEWDVSSITISEVRQALLENLLEPVDYTVLDKNKLAPGVIYKDVCVASTSLGTGLVYRKDKFPNGGPQTWADYWDAKKFPQIRGGFDQPYSMLAFALLADGVPKDKIYPMDLDRAFKKMSEIKPHIKVWWTQGTQSQTLIESGEVDMVPMWNGRAQELIDRGVPLEIMWPGTQVSFTQRFVPKGTPRAKLAWKYIEFTSLAKPMADFARGMNYGPSNPEAFKYLSPTEAAKMPSSEEHLKVGFIQDDEWLAPNLAKMRERWTQWIAG